MRQLATIQKINKLEKIDGADSIELASVLGWHLVVKKGEFKVNDPCIFIEVDSLLPIREEFNFLSDRGTKTILVDGKEVEGYRLKTIKLREQISQGLCLPLSLLGLNNLPEGYDVTQILGIHKYEKPVSASLVGLAKGEIPSYIRKTDETRLQSIPRVLTFFSNIVGTIKPEYYVTEKIDGTSMTVFYTFDNQELHVCSRNLEWKEESNNSYWQMANKLGLKDKLRISEEGLVIQGELAGEGIQGNPLKIKGHRFFVFNIFNLYLQKYLSLCEMLDFCSHAGIDTVPVIETNFKLKDSVDEMVEYANRKSLLNPNELAEGIVVRSDNVVDTKKLNKIAFKIYGQMNDRISFKVLNPYYLLKHD